MASLSNCWSTESLLWKQWDTEPIIYNIASGNTHVVSSIAAKILQQLEQQPSTASRVAENLASEFDVESDQEVVEQVERLISDLDALGLLKPVTE